jgi:hypothetical protein
LLLNWRINTRNEGDTAALTIVDYGLDYKSFRFIRVQVPSDEGTSVLSQPIRQLLVDRVGPLLLLLVFLVAALPAYAGECGVQRLPVADSHVGNDDSDGGTVTFPSPSGCRIATWKFIELSKYGDASYSASMRTDGVLVVQWHIHSTRVRGPFKVVVDTHTAALHLAIEITSAPVEAPSTSPSSTTVQSTAKETTKPLRLDIISIGSLAVGIVMGVIAGLIVANAKAWQLKLGAGLVSLLFAGAATQFLEVGKPSRFLYPIGLLLGLIVVRLWRVRQDATTDIPAMPRRIVSALEALILLTVLVVTTYLAIASIG